MVREGRGVSIRRVLLVGLAAAALAYPALRVWTGRGHALPPASWGGVVVLVFMASGVFFAGLPIRRFLRGQARKPLNPLRAMRTLVLAQAAALTGALVGGWYLAQLLVLSPDLDVSSVREIAVRLAALVTGGVVMAIAGLVAQSMCRYDEGDRRDDGDRSDEDDNHDQTHDHHH